MEYTVDPAITAVFEKLLADPLVRKAFAFIDKDHENKVAEQKEMTLVHGAPFKEREKRSPMYKEKLEKYGAADCFMDKHDNAFGYVRGGSGPLIVFEGHLDTVFPEETPLKITEKDGRIYCPGIGDDTAGLANVLALLRAIKHAGLEPVGTLMLGGTAGEEGEGDIRGIKGLLDDHKDIAAVVNVEPGSTGNIVFGAVGSRRYEFIFRGPGGHSWSKFGLPSPIHAMGRAIAKMADIDPPATPKTTYTVGTVTGGTSVNSIALEARMKLDMRSMSMDALADLEKTMLKLVDAAVAEENFFRKESGAAVTVEKKKIGDRPAGDQPQDAPIVQALWAAITAIGKEPKLLPPSSTNANAAISRKVPGVVLRTGGDAGGEHALEEWFDPRGSQEGVKTSLLMAFALAGLKGVTEPIKLK
ncbi:Peptidase M20 [uncultured delta proteobacterium]|uniref:Peptidase M20 n=1 Tax=uncultured delta proteobacterium TaxID=34034 RepID=A0A212KD05_9DELT|nr:Peptidase M20 [uncultured delta proteobacterium]